MKLSKRDETALRFALCCVRNGEEVFGIGSMLEQFGGPVSIMIGEGLNGAWFELGDVYSLDCHLPGNWDRVITIRFALLVRALLRVNDMEA